MAVPGVGKSREPVAHGREDTERPIVAEPGVGNHRVDPDTDCDPDPDADTGTVAVRIPQPSRESGDRSPVSRRSSLITASYPSARVIARSNGGSSTPFSVTIAVT